MCDYRRLHYNALNSRIYAWNLVYCWALSLRPQKLRTANAMHLKILSETKDWHRLSILRSARCSIYLEQEVNDLGSPKTTELVRVS
jgi:hypothetical protein